MTRNGIWSFQKGIKTIENMRLDEKRGNKVTMGLGRILQTGWSIGQNTILGFGVFLKSTRLAPRADGAQH